MKNRLYPVGAPVLHSEVFSNHSPISRHLKEACFEATDKIYLESFRLDLSSHCYQIISFTQHFSRGLHSQFTR